jgi:hypothetical protein
MLRGNARQAVDQEVPAPRGPIVGGNACSVTHLVFGPDPIASRFIGSWFVMNSLVSPAASGRFRPGDKGAMEHRDGRDIGPLQNFRGKALIVRDLTSPIHAQGGPGNQPAFPGTGGTVAPSIINSLAGMDLPQTLRT